MKNSQKSSTMLALFLLIPLLFFFSSCDSKNDTSITSSSGNGTSTGSYNVTLNGSIYDAGTGLILDSVLVRVLYGAKEIDGTTDSYGNYSIQFTIDTNMVVTVISSITNYVTDTSKVYAQKNAVNSVSAISLKAVATTSTTRKSGYAASIFLSSQASTSIGVRSGGSFETGSITFQAVDSLGVGLDLTHSALVKFSFGGHPNGGEYLTPTYAFTDSAGKATVFLTSGTVAGVVQVIAEIYLPTVTLTSLPVAYTINGGLPDASHFSIASQYLNFPGYDQYGLTNSISAYVGDKYGNPVRPNTSVYFTTTGGIIPGSANTSNSGVASVNLLSAAPAPSHAIFGTGFATITATTIDETKQVISSNGIVLFSGVPSITVTPSTFDIPNAGSQTFNYDVKDENNNPLAPNSTINITVEGDNVKTSGQTSIILPDTQSKTATHYSFQIYDSQDTVTVLKKINVSIKVTGPNGKADYSFSGTSK